MAGTNIRIGANSSEFQKQMKEVTTQLKLVSSECGVASEKAKLFGNATDKLSASQKELTAKIKAQTQISKLYQDRILNINSQIDKQKSKQSELSKKIEEATEKHKKSIETTGKNSAESKKLQEEIKKLKEEYAKNERAIEANNKKLVDATTKMNNNEKNLLKNKKALQEVTKELNTGTDKLKKFTDGLDKASEKTTNFGKKASVISAGVAGIGAAGVAAFKEVDAGMDNVVKATGATGETAKELEAIYKNLSSSINKDFTEIGSALGEVNTRFQFTGKELETCTMQFLEFSKINNIDTTQAVQLVSRAMGDAGIEAKNYSELLDMLTSAAQASGIGIDKLTELLTKYGAPMRALGFDTKEAIAIFSQWELAGVNTEIAFSGMKAAIGKWGKEGKDARVEFKKTLDEIAKAPNIAKATSKSIEVFGQKAGPDLADAIQGGRFEYDKFLKILDGSGGVVDSTFNQVQDGTDKAAIAMNSLKVTSSEFGSVILQSLTPTFENISKVLSNCTKWLNGLDDSTKSNVVTAGMFVAAIGPVLIVLGSLGKGISNTIKGYKDLVKFGGSAIKKIKDFGPAALNGAKAAGNFALGLGKTALNFSKAAIQAGISAASFIGHKIATMASTVATGAFTVAQKALNLVMKMNPIVRVITLLLGLGAVFVTLYQKCEWFRNAVDSVWSFITSVFTTFDDFLKGVFSKDWTNSFGVFGNILNAFCANVQNIFNSIKRIFQGIIDFVVGGFTGDWSRAWEGVKNIFGGIMDGLGAVIKAPLNTVIGLINACIDGLNSISFTAPEWVPGVGGKHFGVNIPKMNYLYNGGIIEKPTLLNFNTVVGDAFNGKGNKTEAVIPLDVMYRKIRSIVKEENSVKSNDSKIIEVNMQVGSKTVARAIFDEYGKLISKSQRSRGVARGKACTT